MAEQPKLIYWDADVFLSYINGVTDRLSHLDPLLEQSGKDIQIITSTISVVEVAFGKMEQDKRALDEEVEYKINTLWATKSPVKLIEFFPNIAERAKGLMRHSMTQGWSLKPMDAIHLGTAHNQGCAEFHTYDEALSKFSIHLEMSIMKPASGHSKLPRQN